MTLQEQLITEILDPRSSLSPREVAAAEEIRWLRTQVPGIKESWNIPAQKAGKDAVKSLREVDK
jgi:hypothetical protein